MRVALEDRPTAVLPRMTASGAPYAPPVLGPLLRALLPALAAAAVAGMVLPGPLAAPVGAVLPMLAAGVTLFRVIRSTDRGY
jgi:hypothetical protein